MRDLIDHFFFNFIWSQKTWFQKGDGAWEIFWVSGKSCSSFEKFCRGRCFVFKRVKRDFQYFSIFVYDWPLNHWGGWFFFECLKNFFKKFKALVNWESLSVWGENLPSLTKNNQQPGKQYFFSCGGFYERKIFFNIFFKDSIKKNFGEKFSKISSTKIFLFQFSFFEKIGKLTQVGIFRITFFFWWIIFERKSCFFIDNRCCKKRVKFFKNENKKSKVTSVK